MQKSKTPTNQLLQLGNTKPAPVTIKRLSLTGQLHYLEMLNSDKNTSVLKKR